MAESKYDKYFITELKKNIKVPAFRDDHPGQPDPPGQRHVSDHIIWLDNEVIPGARIYSECVWFWPGPMPKLDPEKIRRGEQGLKPHSHGFEELIAFVGTDVNNPYELGGEIELWLDGEQHIMTKSFYAYVPANMVHGPLAIHRIDKPIFHFTIGPSTEYK